MAQNHLAALAKGAAGPAMAGENRLADLAQMLQGMGRTGSVSGPDTILAHINPREAALLDAVTDGASVNPRTGLLEFLEGETGGVGDTGSGGGGISGGEGRDTYGMSEASDPDFGADWGGPGIGGVSIDRNVTPLSAVDPTVAGFGFGMFGPPSREMTNVSFDQSPTAFDIDTPLGRLSMTQQDLALNAMTAMSPIGPGAMAAMSSAARSIGDGITGFGEALAGQQASSPVGSVSHDYSTADSGGAPVSVGSRSANPLQSLYLGTMRRA